MTGGDDDARLVAAALGGDANAFTQLMRRHKDALYRFVRRYVGDAEESYDLVQEAFVAAWASLASFDRTRSFPAWLKRIALNKCRDWSRRRTVRRFFFGALSLDVAHEEIAAPEIEANSADADLAALDRAIAALPANLKEPLLLTVFDGMSHREAGAILNLSPKAIETRVYRARLALAKALLTEDDAGEG